MNQMENRKVERIRKEYPEGTRVELVYMNDPYTKLKKGIQGNVDFVDDSGTVHTRWDNGTRLGAVLDAGDEIRKI